MQTNKISDFNLNKKIHKRLKHNMDGIMNRPVIFFFSRNLSTRQLEHNLAFIGVFIQLLRLLFKKNISHEAFHDFYRPSRSLFVVPEIICREDEFLSEEQQITTNCTCINIIYFTSYSTAFYVYLGQILKKGPL